MPRLGCSEVAAGGKFEISPWREFGEMKYTPVFSLIFQPKNQQEFLFLVLCLLFPTDYFRGKENGGGGGGEGGLACVAP
jgi:hypothetical protein